MGIISRLMERRSTPANPDAFILNALGLGGPDTTAGVTVTPDVALTYGVVYACVRIRAETISSLPLPVYRRLQPRGKARAPDYPLYEVLHDIANPEMTAMTLREIMQGHLDTWGNGYAEIERDKGGHVKALWPLSPNKMRVARENGQLMYWYGTNAGEVPLIPSRVLHIPGFGFDGLIGYSPIRLHREAIAGGLATQEYGNRFFANGARPGGILSHPKTLSEPAAQRLKSQFEKDHGGLSQSHRLKVLEEGMSYTAIGIPPEDAQFLETRKFQVTEIARIFRVPPHMLADLDRATFSNIEHQSIEFVVHTIRPWLVRWEQSINLRLLGPDERGTYFAEHLVDGLLRGDIKSRYEAYAVGRQNGWLSANDIREFENLNPVDGGDIYLVNGNMMPVDQANKSDKGVFGKEGGASGIGT